MGGRHEAGLYPIFVSAFLLGLRIWPADAQTNLIMTTMSPPGNAFSSQFFGPWAERINEAAKGTINVDPRDGFAIAELSRRPTISDLNPADASRRIGNSVQQRIPDPTLLASGPRSDQPKNLPAADPLRARKSE